MEISELVRDLESAQQLVTETPAEFVRRLLPKYGILPNVIMEKEPELESGAEPDEPAKPATGRTKRPRKRQRM